MRFSFGFLIGFRENHALIMVCVLFFLVYLGRFLGSLPYLHLDRTAIALSGTLGLLVSESVSTNEASTPPATAADKLRLAGGVCTDRRCIHISSARGACRRFATMPPLMLTAR